MERLRALFEELGFKNVRTYIQTGNVFFETARSDERKLEAKLEQHLSKALGYDVVAFVRTRDELEKPLRKNPFRGIRVTPDMRLYVMFISPPLPKDVELPHRSKKGEYQIVATENGMLFVVYHLLGGRHINLAAVLEKAFGVKATGRFYETMLKMLDSTKNA